MTEIKPNPVADLELINSIANKYLDVMADGFEVTEENIRDDVNWIYSQLGKSPPEIIITTPEKFKKIIKTKYLLEDNDAISFRLPIKNSRKQFRDALYKYNKDIPNEPIRRYMNALRSIDIGFLDGLAVQSWFMYSEYILKKYKIAYDDHERYRNFYKKIFTFQMYNDRIIIIKKPTIKFAAYRLHSTSGRSVSWKDGGFYHIRGIRFDEKLWKAVKNRTMPVMEILKLENIEQRYTAVEFYGAELIMKQIKATLVDESPRGNKLYEFNEEGQRSNRTLKFLRYQCKSTDRVYMSFVPTSINKADEGMAWKFDMTEEEYSMMTIEA